MKIIQTTINNDPYRYIIIDEDTGEVIDDAQGYGYKNKQKAYAAYNYKYNGGREKLNGIKAFWREHKDIEKYCSKWFECNFKEYARGESTLKDLQTEIKENFDVDVPIKYLKKACN